MTNLSLPLFFGSNIAGELEQLWHGVISLCSKKLSIFWRRSFLKCMGIRRLGNFTGFKSILCWTRSHLPISYSDFENTSENVWRSCASCARICEPMENWVCFFYFLNVVLVSNLNLRLVRQVCDDSMHCRFFCGSIHGKNSQGRAPLNNYIFNRINEVSWYHLSRLTKRTEDQ